MERVLWQATRRLAVLVVGVVLTVGSVVALGERHAVVASAAAIGSALLAAVALAVVAYAWREQKEPPPAPLASARTIYRHPARVEIDAAPGIRRAARASALAFMLLSFAGTAAIVAAAAR
jgi:hypothetical protein